jgi:hypothetical protein
MYKLSELEESLSAFLSQCDKETYMDVLLICGIIPEGTEIEEIDWEN